MAQVVLRRNGLAAAAVARLLAVAEEMEAVVHPIHIAALLLHMQAVVEVEEIHTMAERFLVVLVAAEVAERGKVQMEPLRLGQ
jgi:hypothetical protein